VSLTECVLRVSRMSCAGTFTLPTGLHECRRVLLTLFSTRGEREGVESRGQYRYLGSARVASLNKQDPTMHSSIAAQTACHVWQSGCSQQLQTLPMSCLGVMVLVLMGACHD
jgi:hypothetical protein